jgi:hypothetical protein
MSVRARENRGRRPFMIPPCSTALLSVGHSFIKCSYNMGDAICSTRSAECACAARFINLAQWVLAV